MLKDRKRGFKNSRIRVRIIHKITIILFALLALICLVYFIFIKPSGNLNQTNADYRFSLRTTAKNYHAPEGRRIDIPLAILNTGKKPWISEGDTLMLCPTIFWMRKGTWSDLRIPGILSLQRYQLERK